MVSTERVRGEEIPGNQYPAAPRERIPRAYLVSAALDHVVGDIRRVPIVTPSGRGRLHPETVRGARVAVGTAARPAVHAASSLSNVRWQYCPTSRGGRWRPASLRGPREGQR